MPHCPLQDKRCGGCTRLSVPYEQQLQSKQKRIEKLFDRVMPISGMASPYRYRNKIIAAAAHDRDGLLTGQYVYGTHYVLRQNDCLLENEEAVRIVNTARRILNDHHILSWDENKRTGLLRFIQVRYAARTGQALVTFVTSSGDFAKGQDITRELRTEIPAVRGVIRNINDRPGSAVLGFEEHVLDGANVIEDQMCGLRVFLSSRAFYQINTEMAERLYMRAIELADISDSDTVLDAYCGIGLIGMLAAPKAKEVVGIEQNPSAIRLAQRIEKANDIRNIGFKRGDAASVLKNRTFSADVVFVDPPREGMSAAMLEALGSMRPGRIVYISCNPVTQARDTAALKEYGYACSPVWPFDLFPHTEHVETVCCLSHPKDKSISVPYEPKNLKNG